MRFFASRFITGTIVILSYTSGDAVQVTKLGRLWTYEDDKRFFVSYKSRISLCKPNLIFFTLMKFSENVEVWWYHSLCSPFYSVTEELHLFEYRTLVILLGSKRSRTPSFWMVEFMIFLSTHNYSSDLMFILSHCHARY